MLALTLPAALWAATFGLPAAAESPTKTTRPLPPSPLAGLIAAADTDQDGALSRAELAAVDVFAKLDANQDGKIDDQDVDRVFFARAPHGGFLLRMAAEENDGKLTRADWQAWLAKADADGDGVLQSEELRSLMPEPPVPPTPPEPPVAPTAPGVPAPVAVPRPPAPPAPPVPPVPPTLDTADLAAAFDKFDANKDGQIDGSELPPSRMIWRQRLVRGSGSTIQQ
jgi:Ca2+-binding EF-hand superfamily protein